MAEPTTAELPESPKAMLEIVERAQQGDADAMPVLRSLLDRVPEIRDALGADLERAVETAISKSMAGDENLAFGEALRRKLAALREELEGPSPSPTERLLVDRAIACWLRPKQ